MVNSLYNIQYYLDIQRIELEEHRYYLGERLGREIEDYELVEDWINNGHNKRFNEAYLDHKDEIEGFMVEHEEKGDLEKALTMPVVHELLRD